jgi:hypothetical protein
MRRVREKLDPKAAVEVAAAAEEAMGGVVADMAAAVEAAAMAVATAGHAKCAKFHQHSKAPFREIWRFAF